MSQRTNGMNEEDRKLVHLLFGGPSFTADEFSAYHQQHGKDLPPYPEGRVKHLMQLAVGREVETAFRETALPPSPRTDAGSEHKSGVGSVPDEQVVPGEQAEDNDEPPPLKTLERAEEARESLLQEIDSLLSADRFRNTVVFKAFDDFYRAPEESNVFGTNEAKDVPFRNTAAITTGLREPLLLNGILHAHPSVDLKAVVHDVQLRFAVEANAGVLECLDYQPLEAILPERLMRDCWNRSLAHCKNLLYGKIFAVCRRANRRRARVADGGTSSGTDAAVGTTDAAVGKTVKPRSLHYVDVILNQFHELPDQQRAALFLFHYDRTSTARTAELLGLQGDSFQGTLEQATTRLHDALHDRLQSSIRCGNPPALIDEVLKEAAGRVRDMVQSASENNRTLQAIRGKLSPLPHPRLGLPIVQAVVLLRSQRVRQAKEHIRRVLTREVAKLAEKYKATSAWLFLPEPDGHLRAGITHNSVCRGFRMPISGMPGTRRGIVPLVARTKKGICLPDVRKGPHKDHYETTVVDTRSELTVAIPESGPDSRLLGVLNLESNKVGKFRQENIEQLEVDVKELIVHLLALEEIKEDNVSAWPWHPAIDGWSLGRFLGDICDAVTSFAPKAKDDVLTATIWLADWSKGTLFAGATSGYDYEFLSDRMLPIDSFSGNVARLKRGKVRYGSSDSPEFVEWAKADDMGLTHITATPVYRPGAKEGDPAVGTLNLYLLTQLHMRLIPSRREVQELADIIGAILSKYETSRERMALAYLHSKLARASYFSYCEEMALDNQLTTLKEVLSECLEADGCSVFLKEGESLVCAETTGVRPRPTPGARYVLIRPGYTEPVVYDLQDARDRGIMTYLGTHPGVLVRKHHADDVDEVGVPTGFPESVVTHKNLEHLVPRDSNDRRFLGISVAHENETVGVIRIVRSIDSPPFTESDSRLLRKMTEACQPLFNKIWVLAHSEPKPSRPPAQ